MHESPLTPQHRKRGAHMGNEHGWNLPRYFSRPGREYAACRSGCGIFDLSHTGKFHVGGEGAAEWLEGLLSNRVADCIDGGGQTTFLLRENGSVIDRLMLFRESARSLYLLGHAARAGSTYAALSYYLSGASLQLQDMTHRRCVMALCGPLAADVLQRVFPSLQMPAAMGISRCGADNIGEVIVTHGCVTGCEGYELWVPAAAGIRFYENCILRGAVPCGTATQEWLRIEAGIADAERDLRHGKTPAQAGLERFCDADKDYPGAGRLRIQRLTAPLLRLAAMDCEPRYRVPAAGDAVTDEAGHPVGSVTSAGAHPCKQQHLALAYLLRSTGVPGTRLYVLMQGHCVPARVLSRDIG